MAIKEGEIFHHDRLTEEFVVSKWIEDDNLRENAKTIGYVGVIELLNGFKKTIFWTVEKMEEHALKYSNGYRAKKGYTFWEKSFDEMAFKTILRQLISKWGIMSIEMEKAFSSDMAVIGEDGSIYYVDNEPDLGSTKEVIEQKEIVVEVEEELKEEIEEVDFNDF